MPSFEYKGISGEKNTYADGVIEAINEDEAAYRLRQKKIIITCTQASIQLLVLAQMGQLSIIGQINFQIEGFKRKIYCFSTLGVNINGEPQM